MKKVFILLMILSASFASFAQSDSIKIEQYCQLIATPKIFSNKVTVEVDFGQEKSYWRDDRLRSYDGKLKKFNSIIDALNFMGKEGWIFINAYPVNTGNTEVYHFAFRKSVFQSDVTDN